MNSRATATPPASVSLRLLANKVPEVTLYFWIIKVLCTTVGETASDFLNVNLGFGLTTTALVAGAVLVGALVAQVAATAYRPGIYWLTVVLISIFGTLVTDELTDAMGVPLEASTIAFSLALGLTFAVWYARERTLSIHAIVTRRREAFYWTIILITFALGTAAGDLMAEGLGLGYAATGMIVGIVIAGIVVAWRLGLDAVVAFWIAYILTRPLGASLGDYLSQAPAHGGLGLGAPVTSAIFLGAIVLTVLFLAVTKRDVRAGPASPPPTSSHRRPVAWHAVGAVAVLVVAGGAGYAWRHAQLRTAGSAVPQPASSDGVPPSPLGDLSEFRMIEEDTLRLVNAGDLAAATSRVDDLEFAWDRAEARLKPMNPATWTTIDDTIDTVLRDLRAIHPDAAACASALQTAIAALR